MAQSKVEIYTSSTSGLLKVKKDQQSLKFLFDKKKVAYIEYDIASDGESKARMHAISGTLDLPQIMVNNKFIGTYDTIADLEEMGDLNAALQG